MKEVTVTLNYEQVKMIDNAIFDKWYELNEKKSEKAEAYDKLVMLFMDIRHVLYNMK